MAWITSTSVALCTSLLGLPFMGPSFAGLDSSPPGGGAAGEEVQDDSAAILTVHVRGLPEGAFRDALGPERTVVKVVVTGDGQEKREATVTVRTMDEPLLLELPPGAKCKGTLTIGPVYGETQYSSIGFEVEGGRPSTVKLDLGLEHMVRTRLTGVPCGMLDGLIHYGPGPSTGLELPGLERRELPNGFSWKFDSEGRGYFPGGGDGVTFWGAVRQGWQGCFELALLQRMTVEGEGIEEEWQFAPAGRVVGLRAKPGRRLEVSAGRVAAPRNGFGDDNDLDSNVHFLREASPEFMTVFVDQKTVGTFRVADVLKGSEACVAVDDLPFLPPDPNLQVSVSGVGVGRTPEAPFRSPDSWTMYLTRVDDRPEFWQTSPDFESTGGIVPRGSVARNMPTLATWDQGEGSVRTATATLAPGDYSVFMKDHEHGVTFYASEPVRIVDGRMAVLQVDLDRAERHVIVGRHPAEPRAPGNFSYSVGLLAGAADLYIARSRSWRSGKYQMPDEAYAELLTSSSLPDQVMLWGAPGGNGMMVPLRPALPEDDAPGATLVAEIPRAYRVFTGISSVEGGRIYGFSDASRRDAEPSLFRLTTGHYGPRTVELYGTDRLGVIVRGAAATGVVQEMRSGDSSLVRDWFHATREGVELAGGGEGRWASFVNRREEAILLDWVPDDPKGRGYRPEFAGQLEPGQTARLWVPGAARALRWYAPDPANHYQLDGNWSSAKRPPLGEIIELDGPLFELR